MSSEKLRQRILYAAARLLSTGQARSCAQAKWAAARSVCGGWVHRSNLPLDCEIRDEIQRLTGVRGTGQPLPGADAGGEALSGGSAEGGAGRAEGRVWDDESSGRDGGEGLERGEGVSSGRLDVGPLGESGRGLHGLGLGEREVGESAWDAAGYSAGMVGFDEAADFAESADVTDGGEAVAADLGAGSAGVGDERVGHERAGRFAIYRALLLPLEKVIQPRRRHPEGDALYHSLQVFALAREELPYDEEFQLAALLHDVGKGIDPHDPVASGLAALGDSISERTAWLIEHHHEAQSWLDGTIGARARRRMANYDDYEELLLLARCDRAGRVSGAEVPELDEALASVRELADNLG